MDSPYEELVFTKNTEDKVYLNDAAQDNLIHLNQNRPRYVSSTFGKPSSSQQTPESSPSQYDRNIYQEASPSNI